MADLTDELAQLRKAIERSNQLQSRAQVGTGSGGIAANAKASSLTDKALGGIKNVAAGRSLGGGLLGFGAQAALGAGAAGAAVAGQALGAGVVSQARGGSFQGGASRSLVGAAAGVPILGEALGFGRVSRVLDGGEGDLNQATNQVARFAGAGAITPKVREFLADRFTQQNKNLQDDREANKALFNDPNRQKSAAEGESAPLKMLAALDRIANLIETLGKGLPGGSN